MLAGGTQNLPTDDQGAASVVRFEVSMDYRVNRRLILTMGQRAFWENEVGLGNFVYDLARLRRCHRSRAHATLLNSHPGQSHER